MVITDAMLKSSDLAPLIGRTVSCYWNGYRTGVVTAAPAKNTVSVRLLPPHGHHKVDVAAINAVFWYGRKYSVSEFLKKRMTKDSH